MWFASSGPGTFAAAAGDADFSTLTRSGTDPNYTYTRTLKDGTQINFNTSGLETSAVDRNGNTFTYAYDGSNRLTSITDFNNQVTTFGYLGGSQVRTITDPANRVTTLTYDAPGGRMISITDPDPDGAVPLLPPVTSFGYDAAVDRITTFTDPRSNVTTFNYDNGRLSTVARPDKVGSLPLVITGWQVLGLPNSIPNPSTLAAGAVAEYADGEGNPWDYRFDWLGFGRLTQQLDPIPNEVVRYRNASGLTWLSADELARRKAYQYDVKGNPTQVVFPDDNKELYTYNTNFSLVTRYTDARSNVTTFVRDGTTGNLTSLIQPDPGDAQGLRITDCLNYCLRLDLVKGIPLRFSREVRLFTEENHGFLSLFRHALLRSTARPPPESSEATPLDGHHRHDDLRGHLWRQRLATSRHLCPAPSRLAGDLSASAQRHPVP